VNSIGDSFAIRGGARLQARSLMAATRELRRVGRTLRRMAQAGVEVRRTTPNVGVADVRAVIAARRLRKTCLGPGIGDSAWALLLEAYAARLEGRRVPITGFGAAEGMARSTAHRWTRLLISRGLLSAEPADGERRPALIGLSDEGAKRVRACLAEAARLSPIAG
jgi:hypothetical protein